MSDRYSDLSEWSDALNRIANERDRQRAEFSKKLGEPHVFVPDPDEPTHGVGYWRIRGGVMSYRKYSNGYDPMTRVEYTDEFIAKLKWLEGFAPVGGK
jgi:hypothetical protein